jgi:hypothetical protein
MPVEFKAPPQTTEPKQLACIQHGNDPTCPGLGQCPGVLGPSPAAPTPNKPPDPRAFAIGPLVAPNIPQPLSQAAHTQVLAQQQAQAGQAPPAHTGLPGVSGVQVSPPKTAPDRKPVATVAVAEGKTE